MPGSLSRTHVHVALLSKAHTYLIRVHVCAFYSKATCTCVRLKLPGIVHDVPLPPSTLLSHHGWLYALRLCALRRYALRLWALHIIMAMSKVSSREAKTALKAAASMAEVFRDADSAAPESTTQLTAPRTKVGMDVVLQDQAFLWLIVGALGDMETGYAIISVSATAWRMDRGFVTRFQTTLKTIKRAQRRIFPAPVWWRTQSPRTIENEESCYSCTLGAYARDIHTRTCIRTNGSTHSHR